MPGDGPPLKHNPNNTKPRSVRIDPPEEGVVVHEDRRVEAELERDLTPNEAMLRALLLEDEAGLIVAIKSGADVNWVDDDGDTPLHKLVHAAAHYEMAHHAGQFTRILLENGADPTKVDTHGATALEAADTEEVFGPEERGKITDVIDELKARLRGSEHDVAALPHGMIEVVNEEGRRFGVRVVCEGDAYGADDCLRYDSNDRLFRAGDPMVEFYDRAHAGDRFGPRGQFTGARYYLSTLEDDFTKRNTQRGLSLDYGVPQWHITNANVVAAIAFARQVRDRQANIPGAPLPMNTHITDTIASLKDAYPPFRCHAATALGLIRDATAVPSLTAALTDVDANVRYAAASSLGTIGDAAAVSSLIAVMRGDSQWHVRAIAARSLGQIGDPSAAPSLIDAIGDPEEYVRAQVYRSIAKIADALGDAGAQLREDAISAIQAVGTPDPPPLSKPTTSSMPRTGPNTNQSTSPSDRLLALDLSGAPVPIAPKVATQLKKLKDPHAYVRNSAAFALGELGDPAAVPALIDAIADADAEVRRNASTALQKIGDPAAVPSLITALKDVDLEVRENAVYALGELKAGTAVPALVAALLDAGVGVRVNAAWSLGQIGDPAAVPSLSEALRGDADEYVRWTAATSLGQINDAAAVQPLIAALRGDADVKVRANAAFSIGEIRAAGGAGVPALIDAFRGDADENVRQNAAHALQQIGTPEAMAGALRGKER